MKRILIVLLFVILFPYHVVYGQFIPLLTAPLEFLTEHSGIAEYLFYIQQLTDNVVQIEHLIRQAENTSKMYEMSFKNLTKIGDVKSWNGFMDWYNRQLYLERSAEEAFNNMNFSVGGKSYSVLDVEGIAHGINETYVEYWNKEFSPDQRREMWTRLGLTPANYAYVQLWKEKEMDIAKKFLTSPGIQNNEYMKQMIRNNEILQKLAGDSLSDDDEKIGEKEIAALSLETEIATNKALNDLNVMVSEIQEKLAVDMYKEKAPADSPAVSDWPDGGFTPF